VVDTIHAKIVQSKPRPLALTKGGDFKAQQRAKKITKLAEAIAYDSGGDAEASRVLRDTCSQGSGACKVFTVNGKVRVSRVLIHQLFVDPIEGHQGKPRALYQRDDIDRGVLAEMFPGHDALIDSADARTWGSEETWMEGLDGTTSDTVEVIEAWRLPSGPDAGDGRHVVAVSNGVLLDEPWEDETFPFPMMHYSQPTIGFWGTGCAQILRGIQQRLDTIDVTIERCHKLLANARIAVPEGANVNLEHLLDNRDGAAFLYSGNQVPTALNFQAVSPELYNQREWLKAQAFAEAGVSQLSAQSLKPVGLDSGAALRTYLDTQSERFVALAQAYQEFYVEIARQCIRAARRLAEADDGYTVLYKSKNKVEYISVAELDLDDESYILQVFPISMLPSTPAGKLAALQELMQAGTISQETFYRLADFPDLDAERELQTAARDLVDMTLDTILETERYLSPIPMQDLNVALSVSVKRYMRARVDGTSAEALELLARYMTDAEALLKDAAAKAAPPPMGPPMPGAPPMPPGGELPPEMALPPAPPMAA